MNEESIVDRRGAIHALGEEHLRLERGSFQSGAERVEHGAERLDVVRLSVLHDERALALGPGVVAGSKAFERERIEVERFENRVLPSRDGRVVIGDGHLDASLPERTRITKVRG